MTGISPQIEAVIREFRRRGRLVRPTATEAEAVRRAPQPSLALVGEGATMNEHTETFVIVGAGLVGAKAAVASLTEVRDYARI